MRYLLLILILSAGSIPSRAQQRLFGSIDDPAEQPDRVPWTAETVVGVFGGFSLIGPQWRSEGRIVGEFHSETAAAKLTALLRTGLYGTYGADADEPYDILRTIEFIHLSNRTADTYLRLGPLDRTRLGMGQLVNFYNSMSVWDGRLIGAEAAVSSPAFKIQAFVDDVELNGLVGGRFAVNPFSAVRNRGLRSVQLAIQAVVNRNPLTEGISRFRAVAFEAQVEAWRSGTFSLYPFVSFARSHTRGDGLQVGVDLRNDNFIDTARLHFRVALHFNSRRFLPGYVGPFWMVNNPHARILASEDIDDELTPDALAGIYIDAVPRNQGLETELRLLIFERFEFWYRFMRNFASSSLSEFNTRLFIRADQFQLMLGQDRGSLSGLFSLFNDLGDLSLLRFEASYRIRGAAWILIEARYTYSRERASEEARRFRVERRFDPLVGFRLSF